MYLLLLLVLQTYLPSFCTHVKTRIAARRYPRQFLVRSTQTARRTAPYAGSQKASYCPYFYAVRPASAKHSRQDGRPPDTPLLPLASNRSVSTPHDRFRPAKQLASKTINTRLLILPQVAPSILYGVVIGTRPPKMMLNYVSPGPAPRTTHVRDGCYGLAWGYHAVSVLVALGPARRFHSQADAA